MSFKKFFRQTNCQKNFQKQPSKSRFYRQIYHYVLFIQPLNLQLAEKRDKKRDTHLYDNTVKYRNGYHLLSRITNDGGQQHVERTHAGHRDGSELPEMFSEEGYAQQCNHLTEYIRQQGNRAQLGGKLQTERRLLNWVINIDDRE